MILLHDHGTVSAQSLMQVHMDTLCSAPIMLHHTQALNQWVEYKDDDHCRHQGVRSEKVRRRA
jgi:hypothetical protein